jgi:hypothetical protein
VTGIFKVAVVDIVALANHSLKLTEITAAFFAARHEFTK